MRPQTAAAPPAMPYPAPKPPGERSLSLRQKR